MILRIRCLIETNTSVWFRILHHSLKHGFPLKSPNCYTLKRVVGYMPPPVSATATPTTQSSTLSVCSFLWVTFTCWTQLLRCAKLLLHILQAKGLSFRCCPLICLLRLPFELKTAWQYWHLTSSPLSAFWGMCHAGLGCTRWDCKDKKKGWFHWMLIERTRNWND